MNDENNHLTVMTERPAPAARSLAELANEINQAHAACKSAAQSMVEHAIHAGLGLINAKAQCAHGEWGHWIEVNCRFSARTARAYMQLATKYPHLDEERRQRVAEVPYRQALQMLAPPKDEPEEVGLLGQRHLPELIPSEGYFLCANIGDISGYIMPSHAKGFYFLAVVVSYTEGDASVETTKRPVRSDMIAAVFDCMAFRFPYETVGWEAQSSGGHHNVFMVGAI